MKKVISNCKGFNWDAGNSEKNWILHQVSRNECEQVFFNAPIVVGEDIFHSQSEKRWFLLGKTDRNRLLFLKIMTKSVLFGTRMMPLIMWIGVLRKK